MAAVSIRNLDDDVKELLRLRAAGNGRSMEAEMRAILTEAVRPVERPRSLFEGLREAALAVGGVELDIPPRSEQARPVDFGWDGPGT